jgi:YD repeat-containing protein
MYDANGNVIAKSDFNLVTTLYTYDLARNLEVSRTEANSALEQRTITTEWHPVYRVPVKITEPVGGGSRVTTQTYDTRGNLIQRSVVAPLNDGSSATTTRTWSWTYDAVGQALTATDPNGHLTTYAYYSLTDPDVARRGNLATSTNPLGHVTTFSAYDGYGRATSIVDPNGLATTLAYSLRGWLLSRKVGTETVSYMYDATGQITRVTNPDGSFLGYAYDAAHRVREITDGLGNRISYTLDSMGNRVVEDVYDPRGTLVRTRMQQFDSLNRLAAVIGARGQTTTYGYDSNGNVKSVSDPLAHQTTNWYDALNRITQVLDPAGGTTTYAYDRSGNLTTLRHARGAFTTTYDGLGNSTKQVSPDAGTTTNSFDSAGNLVGRTDGRGVTATYTYDLLDRPIRIVYSSSYAPSESHVYTYDVGANAKGRLSSMTDAAGTTTWAYNGQGRVTSKNQRLGRQRKPNHGIRL